MSQTETSTANRLLSLAGIIGAILVFAVILFVAYLPGRPPAVDSTIAEKRKQAADETRAAGQAKISGYEVIDPAAGLARIPIREAMDMTVEAYKVPVGDKNLETRN